MAQWAAQASGKWWRMAGVDRNGTPGRSGGQRVVRRGLGERGGVGEDDGCVDEARQLAHDSEVVRRHSGE